MLQKKFAPIVYFESSEKYFPSSTDFSLQNAKLYDASTLKFIKNANDGDLPSDGNNDTYYLHVDANLQDKVYAGSLDNIKVYVNIKSWGNKLAVPCYDIQYWFFYPFNGPDRAKLEFNESFGMGSFLKKEKQNSDLDLKPFGIHEGEWSHITIRTDASLTNIIGAYYVEHNSGNIVATKDIATSLKKENNHPVVYVSRNGHGNFLAEGVNLSDVSKKGIDIEIASVSVTFGLANDTDSKGKKLDTADKLEIIGGIDLANNNAELFTLKAPTWLNYLGKWGEVAALSMVQESYKSISDLLSKLPSIVTRDVISMIDKCIPTSLKSAAGTNGPKAKGTAFTTQDEITSK